MRGASGTHCNTPDDRRHPMWRWARIEDTDIFRQTGPLIGGIVDEERQILFPFPDIQQTELQIQKPV